MTDTDGEVNFIKMRESQRAVYAVNLQKWLRSITIKDLKQIKKKAALAAKARNAETHYSYVSSTGHSWNPFSSKFVLWNFNSADLSLYVQLYLKEINAELATLGIRHVELTFDNGKRMYDLDVHPNIRVRIV